MKNLNKNFSKTVSIVIDLLMIACGIMGIVGGFVKSLYFPISTISSVYILIVIGILLYMGCQKNQEWIRYSYVFYFTCIVLFVFIYFSDFMVFIDWLSDVIKRNYFLMFNQVFHPLIIDNMIFLIL